ncbi:hypothetical protein LCGC14_2243620 [marine sediment metagenome]|uniref:Uncharacterized protein n=1 Tax=marine sediment metagenome TaxID=412755 RepID=A0A0F9FZN0_9ZZZZ
MKKLTDAHVEKFRRIKKRSDIGISYVSGFDVKFLLELIEYLTANVLGKKPNESP